MSNVSANSNCLIVIIVFTIASCASNDKGVSQDSNNSTEVSTIAETEAESSLREIVEGFPLVELPMVLGEDGVEGGKYRPSLSDKATEFAHEFYQKVHYVDFSGRVYPSDNFHYLI
jgi:hypothetical protein